MVTLNRPFHYDSEATGGAFFGIMARNYLRFPVSATHGMPLVNVGQIPGAPLVFYADHPPLVPFDLIQCICGRLDHPAEGP